MAFQWNEEQQKVIAFRGNNLLVSAAAGSGKTAVLTQHVIERLLDEENGCDISRLLIMTFTTAAAMEMKERIRKALNEQLISCSSSSLKSKIRRQLSLLSSANISTIHSFCNHVIKEYFYKLDLAPGSHVGDATELKLMLSDAAHEVLLGWYEKERRETSEQTEAFRALLFAYGEKGKDLFIEELLGVYAHSCSHADVSAWYDEVERIYSDPAYGYQKLCDIAERTFAGIDAKLERAKELAQELCRDIEREKAPDNLAKIEVHVQYIETVLAMPSVSEKIRYIRENPITLKPFKKSECKDPTLCEEWKERRNAYVEILRDIKKIVFPTKEEFQAEQRVQLPFIRCILRILGEIDAAYTEEKRKKRLLDYSDLEHMALRLLSDEEVAEDYRDRYCEILVDEYQDSSELQNSLLDILNHPQKLFMVGDVKQSIYAFRQAKPQYFMQKYNDYRACLKETGECICLNKNYRSRTGFLNAVNGIFSEIMQIRRGGIEYDEDNALHGGNDSWEWVSKEKDIVIENVVDDPTVRAGMKEKCLSPIELEACAIAERILQQTQKKVWKNTENAQVHYRDIVILARSVKAINEKFLHILQDVYGIPCCTMVGSAYFDTLEINNLISFLQIVDNPHQDIPLVTTMVSHMFDFSSAELAQIRAATQKRLSFYERLLAFDKATRLGQKVQAFLECLQDVRERSAFLSLPELLEYMMMRTNYRCITASMPGGKGRVINIDMLIQKAKDFEKTNYQGVYQFLRYVEKIKEQGIDLEAPSTLSEAEDVVRIMTIHKSKGLEFPIVYLVSSNRRLRHTANQKKIELHHELGMAMNYSDIQYRIRFTSKLKQFMTKVRQDEEMFEELRVLYVAMTRAKSYLFLTSTTQEPYVLPEALPKERMDDAEYSDCQSYFDLVTRAVVHRLQVSDLAAASPEDLYGSNPHYGMCQHLSKEYFERYLEWKRQKNSTQETENVFCLLREILGKRSQRISKPSESMDYEKPYPYLALSHQKSIVSVSELKHEAMAAFYDSLEPTEVEECIVAKSDDVHNIEVHPSQDAKKNHQKNADGQDTNMGAIRGTAYHEVLQRLIFSEIIAAKPEQRQEIIEKQLECFKEKGLLLNDECDMVEMNDLLIFFQSELAKRMAKAEQRKELYKEKRFLLGLSVGEYRREYAKEEVNAEIEKLDDYVLLRGIIDAFFKEGDRYVIMDYKTDQVQGEHAQEKLLGRYQTQLALYRRALEQMTQKPVKECIIYSFALKKEIKID